MRFAQLSLTHSETATGTATSVLTVRPELSIFKFKFKMCSLTFIHNYLLSDGFTVMGGVSALVFSLTIVAVGFVLVVYSPWLVRRGVLR